MPNDFELIEEFDNQSAFRKSINDLAEQILNLEASLRIPVEGAGSRAFAPE